MLLNMLLCLFSGDDVRIIRDREVLYNGSSICVPEYLTLNCCVTEIRAGNGHVTLFVETVTW